MAGPIIIDAPSTTVAGILRLLYRRALGAQYGPFGVYTTDGVASGIEARRQIVCSSLIDDEEQRDRLKGRYLYVAKGDYAGFQTRVLSTGYSGPIGYLGVSRPLPAALPSGIEFELSMWPCDMYLDVKGLNQIANEALARCTIEYRLSLVGDGTRGLSLADYAAFIDQNDRVDVVYDDIGLSSGDPLDPSPFASRVDTSGATRTLVTSIAYSSSNAVELRVLRAGHTLIQDNMGTWTTSSVGLTADDQAAAVPIPWVTSIGMFKLLQMAMEMVEQDDTLTDAVKARRLIRLEQRLQEWGSAAVKIVTELFPKATEKPPEMPVMVRRRGRGWR